MFHVPNKFRMTKGRMGTTNADGNNGVFFIPFRRGMVTGGSMKTVASDGLGWEHVSISLPHHCPSWNQMCRIKNLFWDADDAVIQIHPPQIDYVNHSENCLHLWRKKGTNDFFESPPLVLV